MSYGVIWVSYLVVWWWYMGWYVVVWWWYIGTEGKVYHHHTTLQHPCTVPTDPPAPGTYRHGISHP